MAVITQKLLEEKRTQPKLQVLIYPWTQMVNSKLPSYNLYPQQGGLYLTKMTTWYLGVCETNPNYMDILRGIEELKPFSLIEDN